MAFGIYDLSKTNKINYQAFLNDLYEEVNAVRQKLILEAFT
jgi:hypothetical protein